TEPGSSVMQLLGRPADLDLGRRRARAAVLLTLGLPGGAYVYQGEELGLPEVEDLPEDMLQDPTWERAGHTDRGRDAGSMVELYREARLLRGQTPALGGGPLTWLDLPDGVLGFTRDPGFACVVN